VVGVSDPDDDRFGDETEPADDAEPANNTDQTNDNAPMNDADPANNADPTIDADPMNDVMTTGVGDPDPDDDASAVAPGRASGLGAGKLTTYLLWGAIAGLAVLAVVAAAGLYTSLSSLIDVWIGDRYRPLARAVLNFAVLCAAAAGIAVLLRRL
jgi:hypothetical protein